MTKLINVLAHVGEIGSDREWTETMERLPGVWPEAEAAAVITRYNATLRPNETPRRLIAVVSVSPAVALHDWEKSNLVTISKGGSNYDTAKCRACGATSKRYGLGARYVLDKKFDKAPYDIYCPKG